MEPFTTDRHQHQPAASIGACDRHSLFAPQIWNTRKVASKLTTSSCSNAAVGEKVARTTIEPTSPHSRHGAARASHPAPASAGS
eukprot:scaffold1530_cov43-Phaeocystis_antarctica.AAC.1